MRITPETLRKIARDTVAQRTRANRDLLVVYLIGSLLRDSPMLGGATDIDLVFIYNEEIERDREIIRLTEEVHLDIAHHSRSPYHQTRVLRVHPWMGPNIYHCKILYDPQHFMDFTKASVSGQFFQPENVLLRAQIPVEEARQTWLAYQLEMPDPGPEEIEAYLNAVGKAANAVASLNGPPIAERRLLIDFSARASAVNRPGMQKGLLGLLGAQHLKAEQLKKWLGEWKSTIEAIEPENRPARLHAHRIPYYQRAFEAAITEKTPENALWSLLRTWNTAIRLLPQNAPQFESWKAAMEQLHFLGENFPERLAALDAFLDTVEETLDEWASNHGVMPPVE
jgi:hypothetical protein